MADVEDYLEEGFDPRSVTMPRLRSILVTHNVEYPASAKKQQLVQLVTDHVLSQASKLRNQRARAKRSSYGIVNAGSAEDNGRWDDQDLPPPSASTRRAKSPRKSSAKVKVEDDELSVPPSRGSTKRMSRSVSRQLSHADEDDIPEPERPTSSRRIRRTVTPQIKAEPEEDELLDSKEDGDSVFTDDNPFQSGSSPPPQRNTSGSRRRTTGEDVARSGTSSRRRTDGVAHIRTPSRTFEVARPQSRHKTPDSILEPGEEFTPDEQLELEVAASKGELTVVPRQAPNQVARKRSFTTPIAVLLLSLLGAYAAWYRQEKIAVGYCGLGRPATELLPPEVPVPEALVPFIQPQCEQCPQHAYCYEDFTVACEPDFVLRPHPLSLGGLVPLPPSCEPDSEKARRVQSVADKAIEELRDRRAKFECGELVNEDGQQEESPAIAEEELKEAVSRKRSRRLNKAEFDDLWAAAIGDVANREEVEVETIQTPDSGIATRGLSSTSLARLSIACALRRSVRLGLARYRLSIGLLMSVVLGIFYLRARYRRHRATSAQIPALVDLVLGRLASQKELGDEELDDPWLFLPNLRDDVLRSVHSLSERERIWQRVKAVVDQNSNVRTSQREGRSGEIGRAWEWIGPIGGEGVRRRRSGRVSWGPDVKAESSDSGEMTEVKRWDEPRPIY